LGLLGQDDIVSMFPLCWLPPALCCFVCLWFVCFFLLAFVFACVRRRVCENMDLETPAWFVVFSLDGTFS